MMKLKFILLAMALFAHSVLNAQTIYKKSLYTGFESGYNNTLSAKGIFKGSPYQVSLSAEYYYKPNCSFSIRLKYFSSAVYFFEEDTHTGGLIDLFGHNANSGTFKGNLIFMPLCIKRSFNCSDAIKLFVNIGAGLTVDTKSNYINYTPNNNYKNFPKSYIGETFGVGINYTTKKFIIKIIENEFYIGGKKGNTYKWFRPPYTNSNWFINTGIQYKIK